MPSTDLRQAVRERIDAEEVAELALQLANIESPRGDEGECAEAIFEWCVGAGLTTRKVGLFEDRFNVLAEIPGRGDRPSLALNAHIDTWMRRDDHLIFRDPGRAIYHRGWRDGDTLFGNPVGNDKGPLTATLIAAKALLEAGVELGGSVYLMLVPGEVGQEPVDEFQDRRYLSKDVGARYLLTHSPRPSYCICAEATAFKRGWVEAGKAFLKVTVYGSEPLYTPFIERPFTHRSHPSAIMRAIPLLEEIERWALEYEREHRYECPGGTVVPRVNVGAMRSGDPTMVLQSPEVCLLYLDVRIVPGQRCEVITRELEALLAGLGIEGAVEQFLHRPGYEARGIEPLLDALDRAHATVLDDPPAIADSPVCSMWRDHNIFNEMGIPALTYGPTGIVGGGRFEMTVPDLTRAAEVYALTALELCGA